MIRFSCSMWCKVIQARPISTIARISFENVSSTIARVLVSRCSLFTFPLPLLASCQSSDKWVIYVQTILERNWYERFENWKMKLKISRPHNWTSGRFTSWKERHLSQCTKMENSQAWRPKGLFFIVEYANFLRFFLVWSLWLPLAPFKFLCWAWLKIHWYWNKLNFENS